VGLRARFFHFWGLTAVPKQDVEQKAREIAEPILALEGLELVDVEFVREHGWILRLYIDRPGGGVGLEDCTKGSRAVETALDVADLIEHPYSLEVSSPGLNRPLKKPEHFQKAQGKKVKVKTYGPIGEPPRKNFSGMLTGVDPETVTVDVEGAGAFRIPMREIAKAHLELEL
jgi:ribosome maturation factor RimP